MRHYEDAVIFTVLFNRLMAIATVESLIAEQYVAWLEEQGREEEAYAERRLPLSTTAIFHTLRDATVLKRDYGGDFVDANCELWQAIDLHDNIFSDLFWTAKNRMGIDTIEGELPDNIQATIEDAYFDRIKRNPYWALMAVPSSDRYNEVHLIGDKTDFATDQHWRLFNCDLIVRTLDMLKIPNNVQIDVD